MQSHRSVKKHIQNQSEKYMHGDVRITRCETAWTRRKHTVNARSEKRRTCRLGLYRDKAQEVHDFFSRGHRHFQSSVGDTSAWHYTRTRPVIYISGVCRLHDLLSLSHLFFVHILFEV